MTSSSKHGRKLGPWRYEGKHFHYRFVNPWVLPLQKPYPQIWIPGLVSPETVVWSAKHRYPSSGKRDPVVGLQAAAA